MLIGRPETFACTDSRGDFEEDSIGIFGTTAQGYQDAEEYIDLIELENKKLRRRARGKCQ
jgi:hypothetical protein